jgi:peptide/nickel transport system permease protein
MSTLPVPEPEGFRALIIRARQSRSLVIGLTITSIIVAMALISFFWTPYDVTKLIIPDKNLPMSREHIFGTDHFGRDILSMIMIGARNSIAVAVVAVGIGMGIGIPLGTLAAARGGWLDELVMRFNDLVFAFPALLSAVMITAIFGPGAINAIIAIGIFNIPVFARVSRAGALSLWPREFILAARASGKGKTLITIEHILPNIASLLLVQGTIQFALGILAEAGLSYLGLGAQPPMPSWGRMLFEAQTRMIAAPHLAIFPGLAIVFTVLGLNLLGDGLSDTIDPKLRRRIA